MASTLAEQYPGGFFVGFNASIDRKATEQLVTLCGQAVAGGFKEVNLLLSSAGGLLDHAHYSSNLLRAFPISVITYNVGAISSCANLLYLSGERRYAVEDATFFFHQTHYPPTMDQVTARFVKNRADAIAREDTRSVEWVALRTGQTAKAVLSWMQRELTMDTFGALTNGIVHEIQAPVIPPNSLFQQVAV